MANQLGTHAEKYVTTYLEKNGYTILARNYRTFYAEVDIVASKGDVVTFVEVKARINPLFDLTQLITRSKQKKLSLIAREYSARFGICNRTIRFDVALIVQKGTAFTLTYIEDAFSQPE